MAGYEACLVIIFVKCHLCILKVKSNAIFYMRILSELQYKANRAYLLAYHIAPNRTITYDITDILSQLVITAKIKAYFSMQDN